MTQDTNKTDVTFYLDKTDKSIIAVFTKQKFSNYRDDLLGYVALGQHTSVHPNYLAKKCKLAKRNEYASLKSELKIHYGYNLNIQQKLIKT